MSLHHRPRPKETESIPSEVSSRLRTVHCPDFHVGFSLQILRIVRVTNKKENRENHKGATEKPDRGATSEDDHGQDSDGTESDFEVRTCPRRPASG